VPLFSTPPPAPPQPPAISQCTTADGQAVPRCAKYVYKHADKNVEARFAGDVRIDLKSVDVLTVPAGSSAVVEERAGKSSRVLSVEHGKTTYAVDGAAQPFDDAGRRWLREVLSSMPARPVPPTPTR
jgi:hypothetical protein